MTECEMISIGRGVIIARAVRVLESFAVVSITVERGLVLVIVIALVLWSHHNADKGSCWDVETIGECQRLFHHPSEAD